MREEGSVSAIVSQKKFRLTKTDLAAGAVFMLLAVFLLFCARYANALPDESYYYVLAGRFAAGDRPFLHTWQMSQLGSLFLVIPYKIYTSITHGTEGIILFMRQLFIAVVLLLYWCFYVKLRKKKGWGILASALLCADQFLGIMALNYYNMAILALAAVGIILFTAEKMIPAPKLVFVGIIFSFAVLNEPGLAFLYGAYTLLILILFIGEKRGKQFFAQWRFAVDKRCWFFISVGIVLSAAAFLIYLQATSGVKNVIDNFPQLFSDSDFRITLLGNSKGFDKVPNTATYFGLFNVVYIPLLFAGVLLYCKNKKARENKKIKMILFLLALAAFVSCGLTALIRLGIRYTQDQEVYYYLAKFSASSTLPVYALSLIFWLLTEKRDRRALAFWIMAAGTSAAVDFFSDITLGFGGRLAYIPAILCVRELFSELKNTAFQAPPRRDGNNKDRRKRGIPHMNPKICVAVFLLCAALICEAGIIFAEYNLSFIKTPYSASPETAEDVGSWIVPTQTFRRGPYKGLRNTIAYTEYYDKILDDLDRLQSETDGSFFTASGMSFCYLYVDRPVGTHSTFFVDSDFPERVLTYWSIYPEKRPEAIYVPYRDIYNVTEEMTQKINDYIGGRSEAAEAGSIIFIAQ